MVLTVGPGHTLREAAKRMTDKGVGAAVVIDEETPGPGSSPSATCSTRWDAARIPTRSASATT